MQETHSSTVVSESEEEPRHGEDSDADDSDRESLARLKNGPDANPVPPTPSEGVRSWRYPVHYFLVLWAWLQKLFVGQVLASPA